MPETLAEHARNIRADLGASGNASTRPLTSPARSRHAKDREALLRELAELARLPIDIAESLSGGPKESLSVAAVNARAFLLRVVELSPAIPAKSKGSTGVVPLPRL